MNEKSFPSWAFYGVAILAMIAALLPLVRGARINVVFLGVAVVFLAIGAAARRRGGP